MPETVTDLRTLQETCEHEGGLHHLGSDAPWLAAGSLLTVNGTLIGRALQTVTQVVLARFLGPVDFGLYAIGWTLLRVSTILTPLGLDNGAIHCAMPYVSTNPRRLGKVLGISLLVSTLFAALAGLATFIAAPALVHHVFHKNHLLPVISLFAIGFPLAAGLRVASASTTVSQSMKYRVYSELLAQPAFNLLLIGIFCWIGWRLLGAVAATVLSFGIAMAIAISFERRIFPHLGFRGGPPTAPDLLRFSLGSWFGVAFVNLIPWVDRLFVGAYLGAADVGVYQSAAQASVLFSMVAGAFNLLLAPRISLLYQSAQFDRIERVYKLATKWVLYVNLPLCLLFCFVPSQSLSVLYGASYVGGARTLVVLSITRLMDAMAGPVGILLIFTARQKIFAVISAGGLVLAAILNYCLIPRFGALGAAAAMGCADITMLTALLIGVHRIYGFYPFDRRWLKGAFAAAMAVVALLLVRPLNLHSPIIAVAVTAATASLTFFASLYLMGLDNEDRELIRSAKSRLITLAQGI